MRPYTSSLNAVETARNIRGFVRDNKDVLWRIWQKLLPFVLVIGVADQIVATLLPESNLRGLFGLLNAYILTALSISWHRVTIQGPQNFTRVNPLKPRRNELIFFAMGFALGFLYIIAGAIFAIVGAMTHVLLTVILPTVIVVYLSYKFCLFFPARATDNPVTLGQAWNLSNDFFWKFAGASILAVLPTLLLAFVYMGFATFVVLVLLKLELADTVIALSAFTLSLPLFLYFMPVMAVMFVTALSNYYLEAQKKKTAV